MPRFALPLGRWAEAVRALLPQGRTLPAEAWDRRHNAMLAVLWAQLLFLPLFSLARGFDTSQTLRWMVPIVLAAVAATVRAPGRRARSTALALGLLTACAVLVRAWDGQIEAHFSFFVVIALMALYEDWLPFGLAFAYVVAEHAIVGVLSPGAVYDHGGSPWVWAVVHGSFVLAAGGANVLTWRLNEDMRAAG